MCRAFYLATDSPVALIPWNKAAPEFNVVPLSEVDSTVLSQFSKPSVVYVGAHTGCSCGFFPEDEDDARALESAERLRAFLARVIAEQGDAEFFACWEGDQNVPPGEEVELSPSEFDGERLGYVEPPWWAHVRPAV
ncbi:MAG: hypothetical protein U0X73_08305 [Thermoanaerobaculia bacterium]